MLCLLSRDESQLINSFHQSTASESMYFCVRDLLTFPKIIMLLSCAKYDFLVIVCFSLVPVFSGTTDVIRNTAV